MSGEKVIQTSADPIAYGVFHKARGRASNIGVIFLNSGILHRPGPFRLYVDTARQIAGSGYHCLRIDLNGKGDSERRLGTEFVDGVVKDFDAAAEAMKPFGVDQFVLIGLCSGADDAFWLASKRDDVVGSVQLDGLSGRTPKYYAFRFCDKLRKVTPQLLLLRIKRKLGSRSARGGNGGGEGIKASRNFPSHTEGRKMYQSLIDRDFKMLCVFTSSVRHYYFYDGQLGDYINNPDSKKCIEEWYFPEAQHLYPFVSDRRIVVDRITDWFSKSFPLPEDDAPDEVRIASELEGCI